jgi:hypothetical protein
MSTTNKVLASLKSDPTKIGEIVAVNKQRRTVVVQLFGQGLVTIEGPINLFYILESET